MPVASSEWPTSSNSSVESIPAPCCRAQPDTAHVAEERGELTAILTRAVDQEEQEQKQETIGLEGNRRWSFLTHQQHVASGVFIWVDNGEASSTRVSKRRRKVV